MIDNPDYKLTLLAGEIGRLLNKCKLSLGVTESATGGLVSHAITNIPGCSAYYLGSVTSYSNHIKQKLLGVSARTLESQGAVSAETACQMASGGRQLLGADICLSDTGIAGPGGETPSKPVGLFYLGLSTPEGVKAFERRFAGSREEIKYQAAMAVLEILKEYLKDTFGE